MKLAAAFLALALGGVSYPAFGPALPVEKPATLYLAFTDGSCSGTAVGPSLVLTAEHCLMGGPLVSVNGKPAKIGAKLVDGQDHMLLVVQGVVFRRYATLDQRPFRQGQEVHWWGNPAGLRDQYRIGYVMGFEEGWALISAPVDSGDSGAGIFDRSGRVVGVISTKFATSENFHGMGAQPLAFTKEQLASVGL